MKKIINSQFLQTKQLGTLFILCCMSTQALQAQCFLTKAEYDVIVKEDYQDQIVGLWVQQGTTNVYEYDSLVFSDKNNYLAMWYIVPDVTVGYKVCHTEVSPYEDTDASFAAIDDMSYKYKIRLSSNEVLEVNTIFLDSFESKTIMYNRYKLPKKLSSNIGLKTYQQLQCEFNWTKIEANKYFEPYAEEQDDYCNMIDSLYSYKVYTPEEQERIRITHDNQFANALRKVLNSYSFFDIVGAEAMPQDIGKDSFIILSTNDDYPGRYTYDILFKEHDNHVWHITFELDDESNFKRIACINKSLKHNSDVIALYKSLYQPIVNLWR